MHFNRTQFAGKRHMRLFSLTTLILIFLLSSCIDADFNALANISLPRYWVGSPISSPRFTEDSIVYDSMPVYKVCSSVRFDPTTVLTAFPIHYRETNGQNKPLELRQDLIDTIDFKVHGPYVHKARITKITGNTEYHAPEWQAHYQERITSLVPSPGISFPNALDRLTGPCREAIKIQ
jgi:hypothetical protein